MKCPPGIQAPVNPARAAFRHEPQGTYVRTWTSATGCSARRTRSKFFVSRRNPLEGDRRTKVPGRAYWRRKREEPRAMRFERSLRERLLSECQTCLARKALHCRLVLQD